MSYKNDGTSVQTSHSISFTSDTECDILLVAGGGGGGRRTSGGGGAGALIYDTFTFLADVVYTVNVGNGGNGVTLPGNVGQTIDGVSLTATDKCGQSGYDTEILQGSTVIYRAKGGGGGSQSQDGPPGGSGGGGGSRDGADGGQLSSNNIVNRSPVGTVNNAVNTWTTARYDSDKVFGHHGGKGNGPTYYGGGGGGGAGEHGEDSSTHTSYNSNNLVEGGIGKYNVGAVEFKSHFNIQDTTIGHHHNDKVYFAGGGGGGNWQTSTYNDGGLGGGGRSGTNSGTRPVTIDALPNTGGGGGADGSDLYAGGNGGSGIVLIRVK